MRCEEAIVDIGPSLSGELDAAAAVRLDEHLSGCASCRQEFDELRAVWRDLGELPPEPIDAFRLRQGLAATLDAFEAGGGTASRHATAGAARGWPRLAPGWAAIAASLVLGLWAGRWSAGPDQRRAADSEIASEMAKLRRDLHETREMVTLSLLQQSSATERLKGVSSSGRLDDPGAAVIGALLDVLDRDPNVNVRLASIDALARFADQPIVRRGAVRALSQRASPLVRIALIDFMVQVKERTSVDALRAIAADPDEDAAVRGRASWGIEQLS